MNNTQNAFVVTKTRNFTLQHHTEDGSLDMNWPNMIPKERIMSCLKQLLGSYKVVCAIYLCSMF